MNNITSANASITITSTLGNMDFDKFSADSALTAEAVEMVQTRIGIDGQISAGYTPTIKTFTVDFEASSSSIPYLLELAQLIETTKTPQPITLTITLPAVQKKFVCTGFFTNYPPMFSVKQLLEPMQFGFKVSTPVMLPM